MYHLVLDMEKKVEVQINIDEAFWSFLFCKQILKIIIILLQVSWRSAHEDKKTMFSAAVIAGVKAAASAPSANSDSISWEENTKLGIKLSCTEI